jgi:hypothetical protein
MTAGALSYKTRLLQNSISGGQLETELSSAINGGDFTALVNNYSAMKALASSAIAMGAIIQSPLALNKIVNSDLAQLAISESRLGTYEILKTTVGASAIFTNIRFFSKFLSDRDKYQFLKDMVNDPATAIWRDIFTADGTWQSNGDNITSVCVVAIGGGENGTDGTEEITAGGDAGSFAVKVIPNASSWDAAVQTITVAGFGTGIDSTLTGSTTVTGYGGNNWNSAADEFQGSQLFSDLYPPLPNDLSIAIYDEVYNYRTFGEVNDRQQADFKIARSRNYITDIDVDQAVWQAFTLQVRGGRSGVGFGNARGEIPLVGNRLNQIVNNAQGGEGLCTGGDFGGNAVNSNGFPGDGFGCGGGGVSYNGSGSFSGTGGLGGAGKVVIYYVAEAAASVT